MIRPVTQRVTGWPNGDCVRASYSSLLGIPLDEIPRFDPGHVGVDGQQATAEREWLASIGYDLVEIAVEPPEELPVEVLECVPEVPHLMSGISPRGFGHRVVGIGGQVAWDPHPSRAGLVTVYSIGLLVPLEVSR